MSKHNANGCMLEVVGFIQKYKKKIKKAIETKMLIL